MRTRTRIAVLALICACGWLACPEAGAGSPDPAAAASVRPVLAFKRWDPLYRQMRELDDTALRAAFLGEPRRHSTRAISFERALETAAAQWSESRDEMARDFGVRACRAALGDWLEAEDAALRARITDRGSADPDNLRMRDAALHFALLHFFTGDRAPARRSAVLLQRFAEASEHWPLYNPYHEEPRTAFAQDDPKAFEDGFCAGLWGAWMHLEPEIGSQTVGRAYDLIRGSGVLQEMGAVEPVEAFLRRHIDLQSRFVMLSNMDGSQIGGLLDFAEILGDPDYVHRAVRWIRALYRTQFYADGWWHEGATAYHADLQWRLRGLCRDRLQGYSDPPGYVNPTDGRRFDRLDLEREIGGAVRRADRVLEDILLPNGLLQALHDTPSPFRPWGDLPRPDRARPVLHGCTGHAVLGNGATATQDMAYATLHFGGTHGHEHADALNLTLFAKGRELISETNYRPPEGVTNTTREWHTMTAGHVTVVVDERSQQGNRVRERQPEDDVPGVPDWPWRWQGHGNRMNDGRLRLFQTDFDPVQVVEADAERAYGGEGKLERYRRTIALVKIDDSDVYVVDVFRVRGGTVHDYLLHSFLDLPHSLELSLPLSDPSSAPLHKYLTNVRSAVTDGPWTAEFRTDDGSAVLSTWMLEAAGTEIRKGDGPAMRRAGTAPFLSVRRSGGDSVFVAVHHPHAGPSRVLKVERLDLEPSDGQAVALRVTLPDRVDTIVSTADDPPWTERRVGPDGFTVRGRFAHVARSGDGEGDWAYLVDGDRLQAGDQHIEGQLSHSGVLTRTSRVEAGDPADAFITPADLPADGSLDGRTLIVDLGGLLTQSFRIARIERRGDETHILTQDEPGMTLSPGWIKLEYFPSWGIRGEARFRIPGSAVEKRRPAAMKPSPAAGNFRIRPRYVRLYTDPGVEEAERNYAHATLDWEIPAGRAAVVCVDCWAWHFSRETQERINEITEKKIAPLLAACRAAGLRVIHMPAEPVASRSKNFVRMRDPATRPQPMWPDTPAWPPAEFRGKTGPYAAYARPVEPQAEFRRHHGETLRDFHPLCRPAGEEPVLADGEDLHRYCARNGILFLIFVGFNTNACVMMRDYGIPAMNARGYETILVRDATTGMESAATVADLAGTRGTIDTIEQFLGYSIATEELVRALGAADPR